MICELHWATELIDEDGSSYVHPLASCDEPATHRALIRETRRSGAEEVVVTHVCAHHATAGDLRLDQLPALYPDLTNRQ